MRPATPALKVSASFFGVLGIAISEVDLALTHGLRPP
jgi:hypothetical protein